MQTTLGTPAPLSERFAAAISAALGVAPDSFIRFLDGGLAVSAEHMRWLTQKPPWTGVDADDARSFAQIADTIPAVDRPFSASTDSMSALYRDWLDKAQVPAGLLSDAEIQQLAEAQKTWAANAELYREHERRWREARDAWQDTLRAPAHDPGRFPQVLARKAALDGALLAWQTRGRKASCESALAVQKTYSSRGLPYVLAALRERYDQVLSGSRAQDGSAFAPVTLLPGDLFGEGTSWAQLTLQADPGTHDTAKPPLFGGGVDMDLMWTREPGQKPVRMGAADPTDLSFTFEFACASIDRSAWFDSFILTSRSWWWLGGQRGAAQAGGILFSNGEPPPDTRGRWQMIPRGIVFARNLVVAGDEPCLRAFAARARAASLASAGLWLFTAHSPLPSPLSAGHTFAATKGGGIAVSEPQIVAVVCQLLPKEPNPEPALLPDP